MFASDLPDGEWTDALIGAYWPGADALAVLTAGADARHRSATHFDSYADHLQSISRTQLSGQEGATADATRHVFARGENCARSTAERSGLKKLSYLQARTAVAALREHLAGIAEDGNAAIRRIQDSRIPLSAKVSGIVEVIADAQGQARTRTADNAGTLLSHIQTVLDAHGADVSARAFAASHGVDPTPPHPPPLQALTEQVAGRLAAAASTAIGASLAVGADPVPEAPANPPTLPAHPAAAATAPSRPAGPAGPAGFTGRVPAGEGRLSSPAAAPPPGPAPAAATTTTGAGLPGPGTPGRLGPAAAPTPSPAAPVAPATLIRRTAVAAERAAAVPPRTDRLIPLLMTVARQRPELRWAIGEHLDGSVVLVTDLAGGWIPPAVAIPAGVGLLEPARRPEDLGCLLADCARYVTYQPGQHFSSGEEGVPMTAPTLTTTASDDLGWELVQVTKWRDGLPRLAHTLARAATADSGWLESEVTLLGDQMAVAAGRVLTGYPGSRDDTDIGNWQLLATIDALIAGQSDSAAYHFAWFQAQR